MARRVFFSFHFENDVMRAAQVRNSNVITSGGVDANGFIDAAQWESIKRSSDQAIKNWINEQLKNTSVTVVLIGSQTVDPISGQVRPWIKYEIDRSIDSGNGLVGVRIHNAPDPRYGVDCAGINPFDALTFSGTSTKLSNRYHTYDWVAQNGRVNLGNWIEQAAIDAGKRELSRSLFK
jgi:hypothetical protein